MGKEDGIATNFGAIKIWNWDALRSDDRAFAEIEISGLRDVVLQVAWSPDGRRLASAGLRNAATLWDVSPGNTDSETRELMTFPSSMGNGRSLCFSPDGSRLVRSSGKSIDVYDAYDGYVLEKSQQLLPTLDARILAGTASAKDFRLRAEVHAAGGEWSAAATSYDHFSLLGENHKFILAGVWVSGYFPGELERPFAPEMLSGHDFNPRDVYEQPTGEACWQRIDERQGAINFGILLGHRSGQTAYAMFRVYSLRTQEAGILLGDDDFHRLWVNGSVVSEDAVKGPAKSDEFAIPITLERGWNSILAKVVDAGDGSQDSHGLFLRISDDPAELATVFMRREEYAEALPAWDWAVEAHPDDESLLLKRAQTQWKLGEHDAAEADFAAFLAGREDDALAIESRARVYLELLRDEGHAEYDRAVRSAPNLLGLRNRCADSKISHDRLAEALDHLQFLVSMAPEDLLKCWELAVVLLELDDEIGYRKLRTEMLSRWKDARNPVTAANVSTIALIIPADEDELAIAVALAEVAVESADDDEIRWIGLNADGLAKYRQGELAEARSDFDSANEYFTRAKQRLTSALEEMPRARLTTRIQATYRLAATLFHLKDEAGARKALRTADDEFSQFDQGADVGPYACRLTRAEAHYKLNN